MCLDLLKNMWPEKSWSTQTYADPGSTCLTEIHQYANCPDAGLGGQILITRKAHSHVKWKGNHAADPGPRGTKILRHSSPFAPKPEYQRAFLQIHFLHYLEAGTEKKSHHWNCVLHIYISNYKMGRTSLNSRWLNPYIYLWFLQSSPTYLVIFLKKA